MHIHSKELESILNQYEKERLKILKEVCGKIPAIFITNFLVIVLALVIIAFALKIPLAPLLISYCTLFLIGFLTLLFIFLIRRNKDFINDLKKSCVPKIIKFFGDIHCTKEKNAQAEYISKTDIEASGLFQEFDMGKIDDCFWGSYKDVPFKIIETTITCSSDGGVYQQQNMSFRGAIIDFKFNKPIKSRTIITSEKNFLADVFFNRITYFTICMPIPIEFSLLYAYPETRLLILLAIILTDAVLLSIIGYFVYKKRLDKSKEIKLEDLAFAKKYNVYSRDEIEARYLVTPAFMERLKNIKTAFKTEQIRCSFYKGSLMIAISSPKNLFEVGNLFNPINNYKAIENFYREMKSVLNMIEYFSLWVFYLPF